ncbi:MAG: EF-P lysine aminoacylase GenX [Proteobacteria bacterium]|nr:EF-P lysine aminoacylase GenX [Pseudomonadota bacterium]MCH9711146.1 EF-P lysine aminoacylase GenX [Pseudomonadota bacterium]MCH9750555.1 EF-P lysine aminoacylase GenX [Pseudomonadota bacterium]
MRQALIKKAKLLEKIRAFFDHQNVLEVQTSYLLTHPTTDVYIDSISMQVNKDIAIQSKYLHTSPELEMKKLLANGSGDIYQICQVFRDNEQGSENFNEFTMLEYYRLGFDIHQLMDDVSHLFSVLGFTQEITKFSYAQAFSTFANIDILNSDFNALKKIAKSHDLCTDFEWIEDLQILMFTDLVEPKLAQYPLCFIYDYPSEQSALARIEGRISHRFELYLSGIEVANGYDELQYVSEYQQVFAQENQRRFELGKTAFAQNLDFFQQLQNPLPQCAGVAIGVDRLFSQIDQI